MTHKSKIALIQNSRACYYVRLCPRHFSRCGFTEAHDDQWHRCVGSAMAATQERLLNAPPAIPGHLRAPKGTTTPTASHRAKEREERKKSSKERYHAKSHRHRHPEPTALRADRCYQSDWSAGRPR